MTDVYTFIDTYLYNYWQMCIQLLTDLYTFIDRFVHIYWRYAKTST